MCSSRGAHRRRGGPTLTSCRSVAAAAAVLPWSHLHGPLPQATLIKHLREAQLHMADIAFDGGTGGEGGEGDSAVEAGGGLAEPLAAS